MTGVLNLSQDQSDGALALLRAIAAGVQLDLSVMPEAAHAQARQAAILFTWWNIGFGLLREGDLHPGAVIDAMAGILGGLAGPMREDTAVKFLELVVANASFTAAALRTLQSER